MASTEQLTAATPQPTTSTATTATTATTTQWRVDRADSNVEFAVKHMMITTVRGRFTDIDGTVRHDEGNPARSQVEVSIKAASIDTRAADRDAHLRSPDFLEVEKYPAITFRSTRVDKTGTNRLAIAGDLTIRGVTRPVVLDTVEEGRGKDPWGGERLGFTATTTIDRRDYGLTLESGTGGRRLARGLRGQDHSRRAGFVARTELVGDTKTARRPRRGDPDGSPAAVCCAHGPCCCCTVSFLLSASLLSSGRRPRGYCCGHRRATSSPRGVGRRILSPAGRGPTARLYRRTST